MVSISSVHFWDGRTGNCGTLLRIEPSNKPHRKNFIPKNRNKWFGKSEIIPDIPDEGYIEFTSADFPGLGTERLVLIFADRDGKSPLLEKLGIKSGALAEELSQSKEREEASRASKEVAEWGRTETAKDVGERLKKEIEDLKNLTSPQYPQYGRNRGVM